MTVVGLFELGPMWSRFARVRPVFYNRAWRLKRTLREGFLRKPKIQDVKKAPVGA